MKCSDLDTKAILRFLAQHQGKWCTWSTGYSMPTVQDVMPPNTPVKVQLAKMRKLIGSGLVAGCDCGCRGDYEVTDRGLALIGEPRTVPMICPTTPVEKEATRQGWLADRRLVKGAT